MNKSVWWVVGLFGGLIAMIVVWLVLTSTSPTSTAGTRQPLIKDRKMVKMSPQIRKVDMERIRQNPAIRPIGSSPARTIRSPMGPPPGGIYALDQDGIAAAVASEHDELTACYETALFHTPGLSGKMTLELEVVPVEGQPHGTVETVDIESDLDATVLEGCIATVFEDLKFAATEITTVRYPVVLASDGAEPAEPEPAEAEPPAEGATP